MNALQIQQLIEAGLPGARANVQGEDGVHFEAVVVSEAFRGKLPLARHRMVYATLGERMGGEIHALALRTLAPGETLRVDTGCLVALTPSVNYDIQFAGGFKNALFGGEGLFLATVTGPGDVWLQSLPFSRLAGRVLANATHATRGKDEGSLLGGIAGIGIGSILGDRD